MRAAVDLPTPSLGPPRPGGESAVPIRFRAGDGREYVLWCLDVGLACCAVEFAATAMRDAAATAHDRGEPEGPPGSPPGATPHRADVLVISGTVTDKIAPAVRALYERLPEPRYVISLGACANSGGPYWDSYCVTKGVDQLFDVDVYVPGCPPRPEALRHGLARLAELLPATERSEADEGRPAVRGEA